MKQLVAFVMIAFLVPATATVAFAKNPCKEDKAKFCKDAKAAGKKIADCLKEHSAELTPACKENLDKPKDPEREKKKAEKKAKKAAEGKTGDKPAGDKPAETTSPLIQARRRDCSSASRSGSTRRRRGPSRNDCSRRAAFLRHGVPFLPYLRA